ncbi:MAG: cation:proton antiporter [Deltaproteobacteria bacterium]|nr:cation:proton antiporter [Deltaproteobacteria bacterium]
MAGLHLSSISALGLLLICGYGGGHLARRLKLPALLGYLAAGVLLGPSALKVFSREQLRQLEFITSIALGCIAFVIGSELQLSSLKKLGRGIAVVIVAESLMAFVVVAGALFWLTQDPVLSLLFGAMAPASAPAGTVAVIQEYNAKGTLTKALYTVVGFDDGFAVIIFGFALALAKVFLLSASAPLAQVVLQGLWQPLRETGLSFVLGAGLGGFFSLLVRREAQAPDRLIIIFWAVLSGVGLAERWHLSPILVCMMVGFFFVNVSATYLARDTRAPLQQVLGLIFVLFFGLAGLHFEVALLPDLGLVGLVYILARVIGKFIGVWLATHFCRMAEVIRRYLGFGILSQAGVAIGLALLVKQELDKIPGAGLIGTHILSTITATSIIFEIIGPLAAGYALKKAGETRKGGY